MSGNHEDAKKIIVLYTNKEALAVIFSKQSHLLILMSVDHVDNARRRCHSERNNSKDDGEGLAGPTNGLIQRPLLIQEARTIGHL